MSAQIIFGGMIFWGAIFAHETNLNKNLYIHDNRRYVNKSLTEKFDSSGRQNLEASDSDSEGFASGISPEDLTYVAHRDPRIKSEDDTKEVP